MKAILFILIVFPAPALCGDHNRDFKFMAGGGISAGSTTLSPADTNNKSKFDTYSLAAEGGLEASLAQRFGIIASFEYGSARGTNSLKSETYFEKSELIYYAPKAGLYIGSVNFGAGYRSHSLSIKSLDSQRAEYLDLSYSGSIPFAFLSFCFDSGDHLRAAIEVQHVNGSLKAAGDGTALKLVETSIGVRLFGLFN